MKPQIDASNKRYANGCKAKRNQEATKPEAKSNQETTKHEPNENVNENVNVNKNKYTCAFETLWKAYPRKKDKGMAYKQYKARLNDGFSEDELMAAVKRYAEECQRQRTEEKYIKHCATFLGASTPFIDYLREEANVDEPTDDLSLRLW